MNVIEAARFRVKLLLCGVIVATGGDANQDLLAGGGGKIQVSARVAAGHRAGIRMHEVIPPDTCALQLRLVLSEGAKGFERLGKLRHETASAASAAPANGVVADDFNAVVARA